MEFRIWITMLLFALPAFAEVPQDRVNFHLKRMETTLQKSNSEARIKQLEPPAIPIESAKELDGPIYDPVFYMDIPQSLKSAPERLSLRDPSASQEDRMSTQEFIEEFKRNAARKGIRLHVDPVTLEVREAK